MRGQVVKAPPSQAAAGDEVQITELEKISPTRVDGVKTPANGFPILMMKGIAPSVPAGQPAPEEAAPSRPAGVLPKGKHAKAVELVKGVLAGTIPAPVLAKDAAGYDESADIAGALDVISKISALVCSEATSLGQGRLEEIWDIGTLMDALCAMKCFLIAERSQDNGSGQGDAGLNGSAGLDGVVSYKGAKKGHAAKADLSASAINDLPDEAFAYIEPGGTKDAGGKTTPRNLRHFPVHDKAHAKNALSRAPQSPFGDKAMPKIKAAAKKFGVGGKKASKGAMLPGSGKNTSSKAAKSSTSTTDVIKKAVAEAAAASEERIKTLEAQLAKVLATPIPGGPLLVTPLTQRPAANPAIAKAERLRAIAAQTSDPAVATAYRELAAREEKGASIT